MLHLTGVGRRFPNGTEALRDVTFRIEGGEFVVLLGPSGCGKSTLLRLIAALDTPDSGTLAWDGGASPEPGRIGFVFQDATLMPWATAAENVALPLRIAGIATAERRARARAMLAATGLAGFEDARPTQLSGGMRMRVSLARALVTRPTLLLMDEPFAALDEPTRHGLQRDLAALWRDTGCTVVFVTHAVSEAAFLARRVLRFTARPGRIEADMRSRLSGPPESRADAAYLAFSEQLGRPAAQG